MLGSLSILVNFLQEEMTLPQPKSAYFYLSLSLPMGCPCDGHHPVLVNIAILGNHFHYYRIYKYIIAQLLKGKANQKFDVGVDKEPYIP